MKKLLLFALIIVISLFSYSQDSTKLTTAKIYSDVKSGFSTLVEKLQGPAKYTYTIYVRQHFTEGVVNIITHTIAVMLAGVVFKFFYKKVSKPDFNSDDEFGWVIGMVFSSALAAIAIGIFLYNFSTSLSKIINPNYYAIKDIIDAFK